MSLYIKRRNLSLSDDLSPVIRFFKARKDLEKIYLNNKRNTPINNIYSYSYNLTHNNDKKPKKHDIKTYSRKLIKEQIFITTHFNKKNYSNEINYDYNFSLLNTYGNRNFFRKNNHQININMLNKISHNNNFFKTTSINYIKKIGNNKKKKIIGSDKINLPKLNAIIKKNCKS